MHVLNKEDKSDIDDIPRNRIQCLSCKDIIESKYRYNFVSCKCGSCSVDGGPGWGGRVLYKNIDLLKYLPTDDNKINEEVTRKRRENYTISMEKYKVTVEHKE